LELNADYIVSGDNHLLSLKHYQRIQIVDAALPLSARSQNRTEKTPGTLLIDTHLSRLTKLVGKLEQEAHRQQLVSITGVRFSPNN
jgi:hypothetical protein